MSKAADLSYLRRRLQKLKARVKADRKRLTGGSTHEKIEAAGDLALAEGRLAETKEKLSRLEAEPESSREDFKTEIEQDFDYVEAAFDRWVERQGQTFENQCDTMAGWAKDLGSIKVSAVICALAGDTAGWR